LAGNEYGRGEHVHGDDDLYGRDEVPINEVGELGRRVFEEGEDGMSLLV
jgi:hypothetical protein